MAKKAPAKAPRRGRAKQAAKGAEERSNKKAEVLAMMKRARRRDGNGRSGARNRRSTPS